MATITGTSGPDTLSAQANGDEIVTGAGQDLVVSHFLSITIDDFTPGAGGDVLDVDNGSYIGHVNLPSFASGNSWLSQQGSDAILNIYPVFSVTGYTQPVQIVFKNIDAGSLTADNFVSYDPASGQYVHADNPQAGSYRGTAGDDVLAAGPGANHLMGGDGNDTTFGNVGNDTHLGGPGNDVLVDQAGNDSLDGGDGNDTVWGGAGDDTINGGAGNDILVGQGGDDAITGGAGADLFLIGAGDGNTWIYDFNPAEGDQVGIPAGLSVQIYKPVGSNVVVATLSDGQIINLQGQSLNLGDWIVGSPSETMFGSNASGDIVTAGSGNDVLVAGAGSSQFFGGAGNDTLWGGANTDYLYGGAGNDVLIGEGGVNLLNGGAGADLFVITNDTSAWIVDFNKAEGDRVVLPHGATYTLQQFDGFVDASLSTGQQIGLQGATIAGLGTDWAIFT